jgi:hypothetical protein
MYSFDVLVIDAGAPGVILALIYSAIFARKPHA